MNCEHLKHAREFNGWTQAELAQRLAVDQSTVAFLEKNAFSPSAELAKRIPEATGFPAAFFEQATDFTLPQGSLIYRRHSKLLAAERLRAYRLAWQTCFVWSRLAKRLNAPSLKIPRNLDEPPQVAARIVRDRLGYPENTPIRHLINKLEHAGMLIFMLPEEFPRMDGFSVLINGRHPAVFLSDGKPGDRQGMTAAHELGHCLLHFGSSLDDAEREAFAFARELRFPEAAAREEMVPPLTLSKLADLKDRWGMAIQALIEHAFALDIITKRQRTYLHSQVRKRWGAKVEPRAIKPEKPRALRKMAEVVSGGEIDLRLLSRITGLTQFQVKQVLEPYARKDDFGPGSSGRPGKLVSFAGKQ